MPATKSRAAYMRAYRARKKAERRARQANAEGGKVVPLVASTNPLEHIKWMQENLRVPTGPLTGKPFVIADWQAEWLVCALAPGVREAGLSIARKNGKSGLIAALILCGLCGTLNAPDWRCVVTSLTGLLAKELRDAVMQTAIASGLSDRLVLKKAPPPGLIEGQNGARCDFLAADKASGHAIGADLALIDEAGLLQENQRALWNALYSCISGRNGKFWGISIQGTGAMFAEMEERADSDSVHWRRWSADLEADIEDESAWHAANPGLVGGIKSLAYMRDAASRASVATSNEMHFRQYDLNQPVDAERETICRVSDYRQCVSQYPNELKGDVILGIDLGGSASMTCAVAYSITTGAMRVWGAFPSEPSLTMRANQDRMGNLYAQMQREGNLRIYDGRVTPVIPFLRSVLDEVSSTATIIAVGADRYRKAECQQAFEDSGMPTYVRVYWRGQGASATADGTHDVRAFQKAVLDRAFNLPKCTMLEAAIANSVLKYDSSGNPALNKAGNNARIDAISAAVIALGIADLVRPAPLMRYSIV